MARQGVLMVAGVLYPIKDYLYNNLSTQSNSVSYKITDNVLSQLSNPTMGLTGGGILRPKDTMLGFRSTANLDFKIPTQTANTGGSDTSYLNGMQNLLQVLETIVQLANTKRYPFSAHNVRWVGFGKFIPFATLENVSINTDRMWHNISISMLIKEWNKLTLMSDAPIPEIGGKITENNDLFTGTIGGGS